ncbi:2EXR domain-containing protein [Aspergillus foveolatus]|uniref:2EXR domain-containing protein n=1 Tax=Aspergillus foveolatus TaxID=210207 RepID=UPI003CCD3E2C
MANSEFHLFPLLPPELRLQIWNYALPATLPVGSAVFPYKKGCWGPRRLTPGDPGYNPVNDDLNLNLEFDHTLLDPLEIELPLLQVIHEARIVALEWTRKQNLQVRFNKHNPQLLFLRPFNADTDTIYVSRSQWHDFICEPMERPFEPDLVQRQLDCPGVPFSRLALDVWILRHEPDCLAELFNYYYTIETVFAVTGFRFEGRVDCAGDDVNNSTSDKANTQHWRESQLPVEGYS